MNRSISAWTVVLAVVLLAAGALADRGLVESSRRGREEADAAAQEQARLVAVSVADAMRRVERDVLAGAAPAGVTAWRVVRPLNHGLPRPGRRTIDGLGRAELVQALASPSETDDGLPVAVLAALALGDERSHSAAAERLLEGELPARADNLAVLAGLLGAGDDPRVARQVGRLQAADAARPVPTAPDFARQVRDGSVEAWSHERLTRIRYEVAVSRLLQLSGLGPEVRALAPAEELADGELEGRVAELPGLTLAIVPGAPSTLGVGALRLLSWLAIAVGLVAVVAIAAGLRRESRAVDRERAFLASVTHELRTPLASVRLFGETLAEGRGNPKEYGELIAQESQRLSGLVERVLASTRVEEAPEFDEVSPASIVSGAVSMTEPRARKRGVRLECSLDEGLTSATWDGEAVGRALLNLLDNALQHGGSGGVVEVRARPNGDAVHVSVRDEGPGIGAGERGRIFGRFERGTNGGTGLGLWLVEQVARAHGGRVDLESSPGAGSTFTLVLPVRPPGGTPA